MHWHLVDNKAADILATNHTLGISQWHNNGIWENSVQIV